LSRSNSSLFDYGFPVGIAGGRCQEGWYAWLHRRVLSQCALFGAVWERIYGLFRAGPSSNLRLLTYMVLLPLSILFFRDSVLVEAMSLVPVIPGVSDNHHSIWRSGF
jgi:hypothetical protein